MINLKTYIIEKLSINKNTKINDYESNYESIIINFLSNFDYFNDVIKNEYELKFNSDDKGNKWYSFDWTKSKHGNIRITVKEEKFMNQVLKKSNIDFFDSKFEKIEVNNSKPRINFIIYYKAN